MSNLARSAPSLSHRVIGLIRNYRGEAHLLLNASLFLIDRVFGAALNFVSFVILARVYGPEGTGIWSYALATVQLMAPLLASSAEPVIIRALVRETGAEPEILGSAAGMIFVMTGFAIVASLGTLAFEANDPRVYAVGFIFAMTYLPNFIFVAEHALKARMRAKPVVSVHAIAATVGASVRVYLAISGAPLTHVALGTLVETLLNVAGLLAVYSRSASIWRCRIRWSRLKSIARATAPMILSALTATLFFRMNYILLGRLSTFAEVGKFSVALSIVQVLNLVPIAVSTAVYPRLVEMAGDDETKYLSAIRWTTYGFTLLGYAMLLPLVVVAPLLPLIFGAKYSGVESIMLVLGAGMIFVSAATARAILINAENVPHYHLISALAGLAVLYPCGLILIPQMGALGAALAQLSGNFVAGYVTTPFMKKTSYLTWTQVRALAFIPPSRQVRATK